MSTVYLSVLVVAILLLKTYTKERMGFTRLEFVEYLILLYSIIYSIGKFYSYMSLVVFCILFLVVLIYNIIYCKLLSKFSSVKEYIDYNKRIMLLFVLLFVIIQFINQPKSLLLLEDHFVTKVEIYDGERGIEVEINNPEDINAIAERFNNLEIRRRSFSLFMIGSGLDVEFFSDDVLIDKFTLSGEDTVRGKVFFYEIESNILDYVLLKEMFNKYKSDNG